MSLDNQGEIIFKHRSKKKPNQPTLNDFEF